MKRNTALLAALLVLSPAALLAVGPPATAPGTGAGPGREGDGFKRLDKNQDSVITRDEAQAASDQRVARMFDSMDANHDGMITRDEMQAAREARRTEIRAQFDARFRQADKNGDGFLSKEEAQSGMPGLARNFDRLDTNKDEQLSTEELQAGRQHMGRHMGEGPHAWKGRPDNASPPPAPQSESPQQ